MKVLNTIWVWLVGSSYALAARTPEESPPAAAGSQPPAGAIPGEGEVSGMTDIHDIKPIIAVGKDLSWLYWAAGFVLLVMAAALLWWLWKRRRRPQAPLGEPVPIEPDAEAYAALDGLAAKTGGDIKQFYFELSAILRHYMERRFAFPAGEMTTEELLPRMDQLSINAPLVGQFRDLASAADPVKYAGAAGRKERLAHDLAFARNFVRQTTVSAQGEQNDGQTPSTGAVSETSVSKLPIAGLPDK